MARFLPALDMQVDTSCGDNAVVRTKDPARNQITLTVQNLGNVDFLWTSGSVADAGSIIIDFSTLLTSEECAAAGVALDGWSAALAKETKPFTWVLRPAQDFLLPAKKILRITIALHAVGAQTKAGPHDFSLTFCNVRDAADPKRKADRTLDSFLALMPGSDQPGRNLASVVACSIEPPGKVFCWDRSATLIDNTIKLALTNTQLKSPVVAADAPRDKAVPVVQILFPVIRRPAPGDDPANSPSRKALTYIDHAKQIEISNVTSENPAHPWTGVSRPEDLVWELHAGPAEGSHDAPNLEFLGPGGSVVVEIKPIRTELPAFPSLVYVLYTGVPGYADGYMTVPLWKEPPKPTILDYAAEQPQIEYGENVHLNWTTMGADALEISYEEGGRTVTLSSAGDHDGAALKCPSGNLVLAQPAQTTTYTLKLLGGQGVDRPPQDDVTVTVKKATAGIKVSPTEVRQGGPVTLSWSVTGPWAFEGTLTDDGSVLGPSGIPAPKAKDILMEPVTPAEAQAPMENVAQMTPVAMVKPVMLKVYPQNTTTFTLAGTSHTKADLKLHADAVIKVCPQAITKFVSDPDPEKVVLNLRETVTHDWELKESTKLHWETVFSSDTSLLATPDQWNADHGATVTVPWANDLKLVLEPPDDAGMPKRHKVIGLPDTGTLDVFPSRTTHFSLVCEGLLTPAVTAPALVNVNAVVIKSFSGTRIQGPTGDHALSLDFVGEYVDFKAIVTHASSVRVEQTKMSPTVVWSSDGLDAKDGKDLPLQFRAQVLNDCTYTAIADGPGGPVRWPLAVTISSGPKVKWFKMTASGSNKEDLDVAFNWGTQGASLWRIGAISRTAPPFSNVGNDPYENKIPFVIYKDFEDNSENPQPVPMTQVISRSLTWPRRDPDGYGGVSQEFLNENVFFLVAWERNGAVPVLQVAERVTAF